MYIYIYLCLYVLLDKCLCVCTWCYYSLTSESTSVNISTQSLNNNTNWAPKENPYQVYPSLPASDFVKIPKSTLGCNQASVFYVPQRLISTHWFFQVDLTRRNNLRVWFFVINYLVILSELFLIRNGRVSDQLIHMATVQHVYQILCNWICCNTHN